MLKVVEDAAAREGLAAAWPESFGRAGGGRLPQEATAYIAVHPVSGTRLVGSWGV